MSEPVVRFERVTKEYHVGSAASVGIKNALLHLPRVLREMRERKPFRALHDVSFELAPGECFGVVGRNGSGKSTTLGLMAGVLRPSAGLVETRGRICPLLELGAGFHMELSGRENVFLNGVLLGLSREEVRARFDDIVAFSELTEFLDRPLRTYSSGMLARLGFSVAVHLEPDLLLVDEVLAVGDGAFQEKCVARIRAFRERGTTIAFVSHDLDAVAALCDRTALLERGELAAIGPTAEVLARYRG